MTEAGDSRHEGTTEGKGLDAAFAKYLRLVDHGETPDLSQFVQAYPAISSELKDLISTASTVRLMAAGEETNQPGHNQPQHKKPEDHDLDTLSLDQHDLLSDSASSGELLGEYELIEELGRGGMGVVYKARQKGMNRLVALKMIIGGRYSSDDSVRRFYQEAKAAGKLAHPNIVRAYAAGDHDGRHFFAMELIDGHSLSQILRSREERLPPNTIARYLKSISEAVHYAHECGILHRDLKPSNVIIDDKDAPKIADFGLAKHLDLDEDGSFESSSGAVVGTPSYMSPEQAAARRQEMGPRSDIYSIGAMLYEMLTGQPPFKDETPVGTLLLVLNQDIVPPSNLAPKCDPALEAICLKCLQRDPEDRYESSQDLAADFDRFLKGEPVVARRLTTAQRVWTWLRGMPLVAFALGRNANNATNAQRGTQWMLIAAAALCLAAAMFRADLVEYSYLQSVEIGVGGVDGEYERIGQLIGETFESTPTTVINTAGSIDSRDRLLRFDLDLCILQDNTVSFEDALIVAPLYREAILVLVRASSGISNMQELKDRAVAMGTPNSGSRATSNQILANLGIVTKPEFRDLSWTELHSNADLEGAILTVSPRDQRLATLLASGDFRLLALTLDELPERFRPFRFSAEQLPAAAKVGPDGLTTATIEAVLAVRKDTPNWFVKRCLENIYDDDGELSQAILPMEDAAVWAEGKSLHNAAREFFRSL